MEHSLDTIERPVFVGRNKNYYEQEYKETLLTTPSQVNLADSFVKLIHLIPTMERIEEELEAAQIARNKYFRGKEIEMAPIDIILTIRIRGIGKVTAARLLEQFGSLDGIANASIEAIDTVPRVDREMAKKLKRALGD